MLEAILLLVLLLEGLLLSLLSQNLLLLVLLPEVRRVDAALLLSLALGARVVVAALGLRNDAGLGDHCRCVVLLGHLLDDLFHVLACVLQLLVLLLEGLVERLKGDKFFSLSHALYAREQVVSDVVGHFENAVLFVVYLPQDLVLDLVN